MEGKANAIPVDVQNCAAVSLCLNPCIKYIYECSRRLECSFATRTKALLIYQQFKKMLEGEIEYDIAISAACLNISIKHYNEDIELDAIILSCYSILGTPLTSLKDKRLPFMRNSLTTVEQLILRTIGFDLTSHIAYDYLIYYLNDLREVMIHFHRWDVLAEMTLKFAGDFYLSEKCTEYRADEIALAILKCALYLMALKPTPTSFIRGWLKSLNNVPDAKLDEITHEICKLCQLSSVAESVL